MSVQERFFSNIRGDVFGGITAGIVALPLALGFGVASGLPNGAVAGMYGAIAVGIIASMFGGTPSQISGPTGPMTVVVAGLAGSLTGDLVWVFVMVALAGLFQIGMGLARLGRYIEYVPYPVISGFMSGIGVIVIVLQLGALLGSAPASHPVDALRNLPSHLAVVNAPALLLGLGTIALIYLFPRVSRAVPSTLVALIVMTAVSIFVPGELPRIGTIPSGLPEIHLPAWDWTALQAILPLALILAVVGAIDSLLTSLVADSVTKTRHDSDQELIGQGLGNMLAGLIGGLPGAGATMRTVVNVRSGGRTHLSGIVHGLLLLSFLVALGPFAERIPMAVLAGILVTVGIGIIDRKGLRHANLAPRGDVLAMIAVLLLTVFVDLMWAVGIGMVISSLLLVKRLADVDPLMHWSLLEDTDIRPSISSLALQQGGPSDIRLVEVKQSLFFGNTSAVQRNLGELIGADVVILEMHRMAFIDQSGAYALTEAVETLIASETRVYVSGLQEAPRQVLERLGFGRGVAPEEWIFEETAIAVQRAVEQESQDDGGELDAAGAA